MTTGLDIRIVEAPEGGLYVMEAGEIVRCFSRMSELCLWLEARAGPEPHHHEAAPESVTLPQILKSKWSVRGQ